MSNTEELLYEVNTRLGHYQVVNMTYEGRFARVLFTGNRKAAFSGIPLDGEHELLFDYIQRLFEIVSTVRPKKLFLIGGGVYTLPMALVRALPDIEVDAVEIDEGLYDIAEAFFGLQSSNRLNIIHDDGKDFLEKNNQKYDMIIIDAFTDIVVPPPLANEEFTAQASNHLVNNGVLAMNFISAYRGRNAAPAYHFQKIYSKAFNNVTFSQADSSMSLWSQQNLILFAQKSNNNINHGMRFGSLEPLPPLQE